MHILLLGATGRTGQQVLQLALNNQIKVSVLVRFPQRVTPHPLLQIFKGDVTNPADLEKALVGCDHVISCLNISRTSDFPWAPLRTPATLLSDTMRALVPLAHGKDIKKIVICSAWGVTQTKKDLPFWFRWTIDHSHIKVAYADHERQEEILAKSDLNYLIVRPVGLWNGTQKVVMESHNNVPKPRLLISRTSLAAYMTQHLQDYDMPFNTVVVSNK